ncbi:MAG: hydantoinase/carbamoylase family amidase [Proteobacteria bacterium]|nr:hydantoinase/carbamoylase family amidase [Pseudomonadota bacterium]
MSNDTLASSSEDSTILSAVREAYGDCKWIVEAIVEYNRPLSVVPLQLAVRSAVRRASPEKQADLLRLFAQSSSKGSGCLELLAKVSEASEASLAEYEAKFGWSFLTFLEGPRHQGITPEQLQLFLKTRLSNPASVELQQSLLELHRIAEYRIRQRLGTSPQTGYRIWDKCASLARHSESASNLTVTFLSPAHISVSAELKKMFLDAGFDEVCIDAVGNVVGRYYGESGSKAPLLLTGSHYDTVRDGGAFDGRVGIVLPIEFVKKLSSEHRRLSFGIELVAFSEEEGVRFPATFLGSSALTGLFNSQWLTLKDADGTTLLSNLQQENLAGSIDDINALKRDPARYLGFIEVHIEQGPVLFNKGLPLGVVTAINGSRRYRLTLSGQASHAGTTPMSDRRDALCAAAEIVSFVESAARDGRNTVATVGIFQVPEGSINTVPGRCHLSLDIRAPVDKDRDDLSMRIFDHIVSVCSRRGIATEINEVLHIAAAPCDDRLKNILMASLVELGIEVHELPSGAGHDAMMIHRILPQSMLFVRGENNGISHNPMESTNSDDLQLAFETFERFCIHLSGQVTAQTVAPSS